MKILTKLTIALAIGMTCASATFADTTSPVGYWQVSTYHEPGGTPFTTQMVCLQPGNTWYSTTQHAWNGDWFQNGSLVQWYGNVPVGSITLATIGMGQLTTATTMSGEYAEWSTPQTPLSWDRHSTYVMVFQGAACPAPA
ncbi:hypothetical protein PQQ51_24370 [Paraburkholderia xenovorans]|uniref:hypothetical protein n=1 Tax=Paraburkholderia xenovorans TaxID=36873 RepID=UPI0038B6B8B5